MRLFVCLLAATFSAADLYVHNPPGSNNRNRERNENRNNANRLFDSQNNGKGGYPWRGQATAGGPPNNNPQNGIDPLVYYVGSKLRLEWTSQHACGPNPNIHCELIIQYACDDGTTTASTYGTATGGVEGGLNMPGLRDGAPSGNDNECWDAANQNANNNNVNCNNPRQNNGDLTFAARRFKSNQQNSQGTNTIPQVGNGNNDIDENDQFEFYVQAAEVDGNTIGQEFGMHESGAWYRSCRLTARNTRLYHADQQLNGNSARFTRQNPNGGRRGLECPEERDYYPYWNPNQPWKDAAILASNTSWCEYFQENSQNVRAYSYCDCSGNNVNPALNENNPCPIAQPECEQRGGVWKTPAAKGLSKPDCLYHPFGRDNHLGNTIPVVQTDGIPETDGVQPTNAFYDWTIPEELAGKSCVLRFRYNMSTADYDSHRYADPAAKNPATNEAPVGIDSSKDCPTIIAANDDPSCAPDCGPGEGGTIPNSQCYADQLAASVPLVNRPYVNIFNAQEEGFPLALAINTHQTGRTFQDRSYVFKVEQPPAEARGKTIWNLNARGRRGNIVQAYPAVEYDFAPPILNLTADDYVHIQFHGSDFNTARNANNGEGWQYSDRTNMVQMNDNSRTANYPQHYTNQNMFDSATSKTFALLEQNPSNCGDYKTGDNEANNPRNCGKLNMAKNRFPQDPATGLQKMKAGQYKYMNTRSNNFSNRSQKGEINVSNGRSAKGLSTGGQVGVAFGVIAGVGIIGFGVAYYMKVNSMFCFGDKAPGGGGGGDYYAANPALDGAL